MSFRHLHFSKSRFLKMAGFLDLMMQEKPGKKSTKTEHCDKEPGTIAESMLIPKIRIKFM